MHADRTRRQASAKPAQLFSAAHLPYAVWLFTVGDVIDLVKDLTKDEEGKGTFMDSTAFKLGAKIVFGDDSKKKGKK